MASPPNLPVTYTGPAVDHQVAYAFSRGWGPKGGDRITVWRHGNLIRQKTKYIGSKRDFDAAEVTDYSNLATGAAFQGVLRGPGERSGFTIWRRNETQPTRDRYLLVSTDGIRTIVGERCRIWRADPIAEKASISTGVKRRACITRDGVVLYDAWLYSSGEVAEERTALKVERRMVAASEVLPPKEAMNWGAWMARAKGLTPVSTPRPRNYDLLLKREGSWNDYPDTVRYRASDGWELVEESARAKLLRFHFYHSTSALRLRTSSSRLEISFSPAPKVGAWDAGTKPLDRDPPRKILGEECRWFNTTVNVSDYSRYECRSKDGIPLIVEEGREGGDEPTLTAVSVSREKTKVGDLMPPRGLLRWSKWGWPELEPKAAPRTGRARPTPRRGR